MSAESAGRTVGKTISKVRVRVTVSRVSIRAMKVIISTWVTPTLLPGAIFASPPNSILPITSGYAMMVHGRGCNLHRCTTTFTNVEITSL